MLDLTQGNPYTSSVEQQRGITGAVLLGAAVWELIRFFFLFVFLAGSFHIAQYWTELLLLTAFVAPQSVIAAGLILLWAAPQRYAPVKKLLAFGKGLSVLFLVIFFISISEIFLVLHGVPAISFMFADKLTFSVRLMLGGIGGIDLLFFFFLLSYTPSGNGKSPEHAPLPELNEKTIEEE